MSLLKTIKAQLGLSATPANNFTLDASADNGTMKLARGNAGATTQDIMTVGADGKVTFPQGSVGSIGYGYGKYLAASLEPDAIEALQKDSFSYVIPSDVTKLLIASFSTKLGSTGRMEQRNPQNFLPLRGVTLAGLGTGAAALIIDPSLASYSDPLSTYYNRLQYLAESNVKTIQLTVSGQKVPFLPGAYGAIIVQQTNYLFAFVTLRPLGIANVGLNLADSISDSTSQRTGGSLTMPVNKGCSGVIEASAFGGSSTGSVSYVLLPASWSAIPDTTTYSFRDDFMGASLNTGIWNRSQSVVGNVEINLDYQWLKVFGNGTWGANGLRRTVTESRANGKKLIVDFFAPIVSTSGVGMVGWNTGAGNDYSHFAHAVNFASGNAINVYENGTLRGTVGSGYTDGTIYRIRITLNSSGAALYEIQGGVQYPSIGGPSWTNITPGTTNSASNTLTPGATIYQNNAYVSDFKVIG